jgi:hypothetical protein
MADTKISDETAAGTLDGTEIVPVVKSSANSRTTTQAIADLGSGGGLFSQVRSATPTVSNTGLSTNFNIGTATVADGLTGVIISGATNSSQISGRTKASPSPTYNIDVIIKPDFYSAVAGFGPMFGWTDGTKLQAFMVATTNSGVNNLYVARYATSGSGGGAAGFDATIGGTGGTAPIALRLRDDGTTVYWQIAPGGDYSNAKTIYSVAKASGYLANYNSIFIGINAHSGSVAVTLMSYTER